MAERRVGESEWHPKLKDVGLLGTHEMRTSEH